jgi:uncharacterized iron-regulated protein
MGLLEGCTVKPKALMITDSSKVFEAGVIISARTGTAVSFEEFMQDVAASRIIYVGEQHTDKAHHDIQLKLIQAIYKNKKNLAVGMEMFDHSYQDILDQWSAGELDQKTFLRKVHWYANWRYNFSLYKEILDFIKENRLRLVGLNIPNHIPPKIREGGIESLRDDEKKHLPQQIDLSNTGHRDYVQKVFENHRHHFRGGVEFENFYAAQSVWEDAMAEAIADNLNDDVMVVLAGNGHIQYKYGIPDRVFKRTNAPFATIYPAPVGGEEELAIADYIWVTP